MRRAPLPPDPLPPYQVKEFSSSDGLIEVHSNYTKALDDFYKQNFEGIFSTLLHTAESLRTEIFYCNQYPNGTNVREIVAQTISTLEYSLNAPYLSSKINLYQSLYNPVIQLTADFNNLMQSFQNVKIDPRIERAIDLEEKLALLQAKVEMSIAERKDFYDKEYMKKSNTNTNQNEKNDSVRSYDRFWTG